jgi:benzoyl-CoA reductase subunit A
MNKNKEFWRWTESHWVSSDIHWQDAKYITLGIDIGSVSSQAVIMLDGVLYAYGNVRTGSNSPASAQNALQFALTSTSIPIERIDFCIGTGYGRVNVPMANRTITEIACHAKGAHYIFGKETRTILDVGGQDIKVIRCDENGKVVDFLLNDKCAAGTGRGMEVLADLISIPINEVGDRSFEINSEPPPVSSTCVVYAKSEASALLRKGFQKNEVLAAYCGAMADRILALIKRIGVEPQFVVTGGLAKNTGVIRRLAMKMDVALPSVSVDLQLAGAIGAALFGYQI